MHSEERGRKPPLTNSSPSKSKRKGVSTPVRRSALRSSHSFSSTGSSSPPSPSSSPEDPGRSKSKKSLRISQIKQQPQRRRSSCARPVPVPVAFFLLVSLLVILYVYFPAYDWDHWAATTEFKTGTLLRDNRSRLVTNAQDDQQVTSYRYNICNGLSNQLLYHASSLALAIQKQQEVKNQGKQVIVQVPNYFIVNGVQDSDKDVLPNKENSVPFGVAFDEANFLQTIRQMGVQVELVSLESTSLSPPPNCAGMRAVQQANPQLMLQVLKRAFRPSTHIQNVISSILNNIEARPGGKSIDQGICVHHRDGKDWHEHCKRWSGATKLDGVFRQNCLGVAKRTFVESLEDRGLNSSKWVYYCGDHSIPTELGIAVDGSTITSPYDVVARSDLLQESDLTEVAASMSGDLKMARDLWALIDFNVCNSLDHFIGNSVSTFSAIQIALRDGTNSFWYNSQSIPLATMWAVYQIPIVYTYTELSDSSGKFLLQASILSVRQHMPENKIHVLYNGNTDTSFRQWLQDQRVIMHNHNPTWKSQIEAMRLSGDQTTSHLFTHAGNYFGTWQRIDIPLYIQSEYCLLLDMDTIITRPFTFADFGLDLTLGIAMGPESRHKVKEPRNAGVMLMNLPYLRSTYHDFLQFILKHVQNPSYKDPSPSDQGAYLEFYAQNIRLLRKEFNYKPYYPSGQPIIVHFHGPKPRDYLKAILGEPCDPAVQHLCDAVIESEQRYICESLRLFAHASKGSVANKYCQASFETSNHVAYCRDVLATLASRQEACSDLVDVTKAALAKMPHSLRRQRGEAQDS